MDSKIEQIVKKWSDYDMCRKAGIRPDINIYDFERVFNTVELQEQAQAVMDRLGIVFRD